MTDLKRISQKTRVKEYSLGPNKSIDLDSKFGKSTVSFSEDKSAYINSLQVNEIYRGKKVYGPNMLRLIEIVARSKGYNKVVLHCTPKLVDFYIRNGYKRIGLEYNLFTMEKRI